MAYVYRRPWRRVVQPSKKRGSINKFAQATNTIGPFVSAATAHFIETASAANIMGDFISNGRSQFSEIGSAANTIDNFVSAGVAIDYTLDYTPGTIVGATNPCLQNVIPSYLYEQYYNDDDLQAFVSAFNQIAQEYITFLNTLNLPVYTNPVIAGALLDWVATGLYGVLRPTLTTGPGKYTGQFNTVTLNSIPFNGRKYQQAASLGPVSDDIYKRILTWKLYKGDGKNITVRWLKRRILRFLTGVNGTDVNTAATYQISVTFSYGSGITLTSIDTAQTTVKQTGVLNKNAFNVVVLNNPFPRTVATKVIKTYTHGNQININILSRGTAVFNGFTFNKFALNSRAFNSPSATIVSAGSAPLPNAVIFKEAVDQGILDMPFQFTTVVNIE